jgi:hypothetical protein
MLASEYFDLPEQGSRGSKAHLRGPTGILTRQVILGAQDLLAAPPASPWNMPLSAEDDVYE